MSDQDSMREFMMKLGFQVDGAAQQKFVNSIGFATAKFNVLLQSAIQAGKAVAEAIVHFTRELTELYYAGQRTNATVAGIESMQFAAEQLGSSGQLALASLENLGSFLRNTPNAEGFLASLGVQTRTANGELRKTEDLFVDIGKQLSKMSQPQAKVYADFLGIDEKTLLALRSGEFERLMQKHRRMTQGTDLEKAANLSRRFSNSLTELGERFKALGNNAFTAILEKIVPGLERINQWLEQNWGKINQFIQDLLGAFNQRFDDEFFKSLGETFEDLIELGKDLIEMVVAIAKAFNEYFGDAVKNALKAVIDLVHLLILELKLVADALLGKWDRLEGDLDKIAAAGQSLADHSLEAGKNLITGTTRILGDAALGESPQITQTTTINLTAPDPQTAATLTAQAVRRENQNVIRNVIPVTQ